MSNPPLYGNLVPLDREQHKHLRLITGLSTLERAKDLNSMFLTVVEFGDACKEFPVVFVRVGEPPADGGQPAIAPLAVLGLKPGVNLFIQDGKWTANYTPAYLRRYPLAMARVNDNEIAVCFDADWRGFSTSEGQPLFEADGKASEFLENARNFLENFEQEAERTRLACDELVKLELLQDMRFEANLPSGEKIDVEGFLAVDEKKLAELPDDVVVRLHRNGLLALLEMHRVSMGNMARLAQLHTRPA